MLYGKSWTSTRGPFLDTKMSVELGMERRWFEPRRGSFCWVLEQDTSPTVPLSTQEGEYPWIVGEIFKSSVQGGEIGGGEGAGFAGGRKKEEKFERLVSKFREISNIPTWFSLKKSELSNKLKLYTIIVYLDLARPWASSSTVGTPRRTNLVKRDCSMLENFWKAMFFITGGSYKRRKKQ